MTIVAEVRDALALVASTIKNIQTIAEAVEQGASRSGPSIRPSPRT